MSTPHTTGVNEATKAVDYKQLVVLSSSFKANELIPSKYTCDGENISPSLIIENIPAEALCLAMIVEDPDAPNGTWIHWLAWNIPVTHQFKEGEIHGVEGVNDFGKHHYGGPCPPFGTHRYIFKIYALNALLELPANTKKEKLEKTMSEHIIGYGELTGLYKRANKSL